MKLRALSMLVLTVVLPSLAISAHADGIALGSAAKFDAPSAITFDGGSVGSDANIFGTIVGTGPINSRNPDVVLERPGTIGSAYGDGGWQQHHGSLRGRGDAPISTPEPATFALLSVGLAALLTLRKVRMPLRQQIS